MQFKERITYDVIPLSKCSQSFHIHKDFADIFRPYFLTKFLPVTTNDFLLHSERAQQEPIKIFV